MITNSLFSFWSMYIRLKDDLPTLSSSSMQMETTNTSVFSDLDKFVWKAEVLSLSDIAYL